MSELLRLARYDNIAVKASALPCAADDPYPFRSLDPFLRTTFDAFGPRRMFWGSDLTRLSCDYRLAVTMFTEHLPWLRGQDRESVMGGAICEWLRWPLP